MLAQKLKVAKILSSLVFFAAVFIPVFAFSLNITSGEISWIYSFIWSLVVAGIAFMMSYTQKIHFYRRVFFVLLAATFLVHFKFSLISDDFRAICFENTPYCHIAIASSFFNYLYQQYLALMSGGWKLWAPVSFAFLWLFVTLVLGRAWCSWACFYGGIDEFFSSLGRKKILFLAKGVFRFRDLPAAILIFFLLVSFSGMTSAFCVWLCPYKFTSAFMSADFVSRFFQILFMLFALVFAFLLPFLVKKRTFCSFLCPFSAWQSFFGRVNPFRIILNKEECSKCMVCYESCPVLAIEKGEDGFPKINDYCNLCSACVDICPQKCLKYSVFGLLLKEKDSPWANFISVKFAAVYSFIVFSGVFSSLFAPAALYDIFRWTVK